MTKEIHAQSIRLLVCAMLVFSMFVLTGCATLQSAPRRSYDGPERSPNELASVIVKSSGFGFTYDGCIDGIDGINDSWPSGVELIPGIHSLRIGLYDRSLGMRAMSYNLEWDMKAGKTYVMNVTMQKLGFASRRAVVWVQDIASSNVVATTHPDFIPISPEVAEKPRSVEPKSDSPRTEQLSGTQPASTATSATTTVTESSSAEQPDESSLTNSTTQSTPGSEDKRKTTVEQLRDLKELRDKGILTEDEYEAHRKTLVDKL